MKKLFAIVFIAGALVACNNSSSTTETTDSTTMTTAPADSGMNKMGDSTMNTMDSTSKMDSTKK